MKWLALLGLALMACMPSRLADIVHTPVDVQISTAPCGSPNGFWTPGAVSLCSENADYGEGFATFVMLHEVGHELEWDFDLDPIDGWESGADEYAVIMMVAEGRGWDAWRAADVMEAMATSPWQPNVHPPMAVRAANIRCMVGGFYGDYECYKTWNRAVNYWYESVHKPRVRGTP